MKKKKKDVFIRSDGWVFTEDGLNRLKAGGLKGFDRYKKNTEAEIGKWHRVLKPLDKEAADALMSVKGMVPRAKFLSEAIVAESKRRGKSKRDSKAPTDTGRAKFMRLTLTEKALAVVGKFDNGEFRRFVSDAILGAAKVK